MYIYIDAGLESVGAGYNGPVGGASAARNGAGAIAALRAFGATIRAARYQQHVLGSCHHETEGARKHRCACMCMVVCVYGCMDGWMRVYGCMSMCT